MIFLEDGDDRKPLEDVKLCSLHFTFMKEFCALKDCKAISKKSKCFAICSSSATSMFNLLPQW